MGLKSVGKHSLIAGGVALAIALGLCCGHAAAQTLVWDANGVIPPNGTFSVANNWNPNLVPIAGNTALFKIADTYNVTFTANAVSDVVDVAAGTVSFLSNSATVRTYDLVTGAADLVVRGGTLNVGAVGVPIDLNVGDRLFIGDTAVNGTVIVAGSGSRLDAAGATSHLIGFNFGIGTLTYQSVSQGTLNGTVLLGASGIAAQGNLNVLSNADLTTAGLSLATSTATATGNVTVDGVGSTLTQSGASTLIVGSSTGGAGTLNVSNSGIFTSGTGTTTVNATGTINVGVVGGGTFNANGPVTVNGGTFMTSGFSSFNLGSGLTLTATNNAQIDFVSSYDIDGGTTFDIQSGADFSSSGFIRIGVGGDGTLLVDGATSSVMTSPAAVNIWGFSGRTADVTFRMSATGDLGSIDLARNATAGTTGIFNVESAAVVTIESLQIADVGGTTTAGTVTVDGGGSTLTQNGASTLTLGHANEGTATINVQNDGTFDTGTGTTTINATGLIDIGAGATGGTFNANGPVTVDGGTIDVAVASGGALNLATGSTLTASNSGQINFNGSTTLSPDTTWNIQTDADLVGSFAMNIGLSGGTTMVTVDGIGSSMTSFSTSSWGVVGATADVTFRMSATGDLGSIDLARNATAGTTGIFNVESAATVTTANLRVADVGGTTTTGTISIDGIGSSLTQNGASTLMVGHASTGTAGIVISNGGTFTTGTGATTINATGLINVGQTGGGTFNANGNVTVDGGTIVRGSHIASAFNLASGLTLTASNNALVDFQGNYDINQGTTFDIQSDADFSTSGTLDIGFTSDGTLLVDGTGSSVTIGSGTSFWGVGGSTADVTFRNAATGSLGLISLAANASPGTTGIFNVESGAIVTTENLNVAISGGTTTTGTVTVDGAGSSLSQNGAASLTLGHAIDGTATINVTTGGTFSTGTGPTTLQPTANILVDGGTFNFNGPITDNGVTLDFLAGAINVAFDFTVGAGGLLGSGLTLAPNRQLGVGGTTTIDAFRTLSLTGGTFNTGDLTVNGTFDFQTGTLGITGAGGLTIGAAGPLGSSVSVATNQTVNVTNTATVDAGASLAVQSGGSFDAGTLANNGGMVVAGAANVTGTATVGAGASLAVQTGGTFNAATLANNGSTVVAGSANVTGTATVAAGATLLLQTGGTFAASTLDNNGSVVLAGPAAALSGATLNNNSGGIVRGEGTISAVVNNNAGGEIRGELGKTLLLTAAPGANAGQINLQGGTVQFSQPLTNAAAGQITGRGTLDVGGAGLTNNGHIALSSGISDIFGDLTNDTGSAAIGITVSGNADVTFWDDVQNTSGLFTVSAGSSVTFFGAMGGAGISGIGDKFMEADVTPGMSPGVQNFGGNVHFGPIARLEIELRGTIAGSQFDQVNIAGAATLDGTLDVVLLNPFFPTPGETFEIMTFASHTNEFSAVNGTGLLDPTTFLLPLYSSTNLLLFTAIPGDGNLSGEVEAADYTIWANGFGPGTGFTDGDYNGNGSTDAADYTIWANNFGMMAVAPAALAEPVAPNAVPEPSTLVLLFLGAIALLWRRTSR